MSKKVTRLYETFQPEHYDLAITIAEDKKTFTGHVTIKGKKTGRPSKRITLHQKALKVTDVTVKHTDKKGTQTHIEPSRVVLHKAYDELRLHADTMLYPGDYELEMAFSGNITQNMDGIYPCNFEHDGQKKQLIATQFESHHAREVFPCIDEPEAKATFQLSLIHDASETVLSNTPAIDNGAGSGHDRVQTLFEKTPIMSTYLLAFVVGDVEYKEATSKNGVKIRTYATPDQVADTEFALDIAVKCMDFYEDYYDIPFPLGKCDFIALPDFAAGAMENWGLITFREQALLCNPEHTSLSTKQWVAMVVAHELTHQWFGNLVTMRWWTDLWLNEGFASWMEYLPLSEFFPEWDMWTQFAVDEQQTALKADSLEHTHPIEVEVKHPDEIRTIFDAISYQKGASVIHMLHDYLGAEPFRDGLRHYLKKHAYQNTDTVDLWQALEDVTKKPVKAFMSAWTSQSGFPVVSVESTHDHLVVSQSRFVANPDSEARRDDTVWPVPLLADGLDRPLAEKPSNNIPYAGSEAPLQLNSGQTGFYRTRYDQSMQKRQIEALQKGKLSELDRMGLLADSFEVTRAGYQSVDEYLDFMSHFADESSLSVWEIIAGSIGAIRQTLSIAGDESLRSSMKPFVSALVEKQLKRLGYTKKDNEPHMDTLLRPIIVSMSASADDEATLAWIKTSYKAKIDDNQSVDADLRGTIYATQARLGGQTEFDELLSLYKKSTSSDEKLSLTAALTSFEQPEIHTQMLHTIKSDTVRLQDIAYWIAYGLSNRHAKDTVWQWLKDNWKWLRDSTGTDLSFSRTPVYIARNFTGKAFIDDYTSFFTEHMETMLERTFKQGVEVLQTNTAWHERDSQVAQAWFSKR